MSVEMGAEASASDIGDNWNAYEAQSSFPSSKIALLLGVCVQMTVQLTVKCVCSVVMCLLCEAWARLGRGRRVLGQGKGGD